MASFQIAISPGRKAAARCVGKVRRAFQQAIAEDGVSQSELARRLGVHRSVICREIRGDKDITLGRVGELAFALGRKVDFSLPKREVKAGANTPISVDVSSTAAPAKLYTVEHFSAKAA